MAVHRHRASVRGETHNALHACGRREAAFGSAKKVMLTIWKPSIFLGFSRRRSITFSALPQRLTEIEGRRATGMANAVARDGEVKLAG